MQKSYLKLFFFCLFFFLLGFRHPGCNKVTYTDRHICALKGSSVDISCTYSPGRVTSKVWFIPPYHNRRFLRDNGRVKVQETVPGRSTLSIKELRDADSAEYRFKFKTQQFEWGSDLPGTTLTVTSMYCNAIKLGKGKVIFTMFWMERLQVQHEIFSVTM